MCSYRLFVCWYRRIVCKSRHLYFFRDIDRDGEIRGQFLQFRHWILTVKRFLSRNVILIQKYKIWKSRGVSTVANKHSLYMFACSVSVIWLITHVVTYVSSDVENRKNKQIKYFHYKLNIQLCNLIDYYFLQLVIIEFSRRNTANWITKKLYQLWLFVSFVIIN